MTKARFLLERFDYRPDQVLNRRSCFAQIGLNNCVRADETHCATFARSESHGFAAASDVVSVSMAVRTIAWSISTINMPTFPEFSRVGKRDEGADFASMVTEATRYLRTRD